MFLMQNDPLGLAQLLKPHVFIVCRKMYQICMMEHILVKGFKQSFSHSVPVFLRCKGAKLVVGT